MQPDASETGTHDAKDLQIKRLQHPPTKLVALYGRQSDDCTFSPVECGMFLGVQGLSTALVQRLYDIRAAQSTQTAACARRASCTGKKKAPGLLRALHLKGDFRGGC